MSTLTQDASLMWNDLPTRWPDLEWTDVQFTHGAFHQVALLGATSVIRATSGPLYSERMLQKYQNVNVVQSLNLPLRTPEVHRKPMVQSGCSAFATSFIAGEHRLSLTWQQVRDPAAEILRSF